MEQQMFPTLSVAEHGESDGVHKKANLTTDEHG